MSTVAINPSQQRLLDAINRRLDELDTAATPAVAGILRALRGRSEKKIRNAQSRG